jgi:phosphatidyl-myo-inositol dimannoside synthase
VGVSAPSGVASSKASRYCFVFLEIFSQEGGIQSYVKDVLTAFLGADEHHRADVFLLRDGAGCENPFEGNSRFQFHYCKGASAGRGRLQLAARLGMSLLGDRPVQVICGHVNLAPLVQLLCQPLGLPYVVMTYGKEVWEAVPGSQQKALRAAKRVWTISRYSRDRLCAANGIDPSRVDMLPCVVDGEQFTPGEKSEHWLAQYGLADAQVLMTVARLWSGDIYKGVDVTIRALPQVLASHPEVKYLVIGRGDDQPRLAQLAEDLGVAERVVFAGFVATEDLVEHYRLADAYVMPSQEGFGIVYLEAMACGKPVLAGDADGSADPLQDGRLGWPVPHRDSDAVAAAILEMLAGNDRRCYGAWLRDEALALFGKAALRRHLAGLLTDEAVPEASELRLAA